MEESGAGYEGVLARIFATGATAKVLDFFLDHKEYDYPIAEVVSGTGLSFRTVVKEMQKLEALSFVLVRRRVGNANMYKLNADSEAIAMLERFALLSSQLPSLFEPMREPKELLEPETNASLDDIEESGLRA